MKLVVYSEKNMHAWLLISERSNEYKKQRLLNEAEGLGIQLQLVCPQDFTITIDHGKQSILYKGKKIVKLPKCLISLIVIEQYDSFAFKLLSSFEKEIITPNTTTAIRTANDKAATYHLLAQHSLPIPASLICTLPTAYQSIKKTLSSRFIVKPNYGLKGQDVALISSDQDWQEYIHNKRGTYVTQEYIAASHGTDLRTILLENTIVGAMKRSSNGELTSNIATGGSSQQVEVDTETADMARVAMQAVGLKFGSVDFLYGEHGPIICEVNANPGFTAFEKTTGINLARELLVWCSRM